MKFQRVFTKTNQTIDDVFNEVSWIKADASIKKADGSIIFEQKNVEFPRSWSQKAIDITASKYFYGHLDDPSGREYSLKQLIRRVVEKISSEGDKRNYFVYEEDKTTFEAELTYMLLHQMYTFNSPVWFNIGTPNQQCPSACFILPLEDSLESILENVKNEGLIYRVGAGMGHNLSNLRGKGEKLSRSGYASGPVSFLKGFDKMAGVIKSGGRSRRSASMRILDIDHPDIEEFITCKSIEQQKIDTLIKGGFDGSIGGEASDSVSFQNGNHSIRITNKFMEAVKNDQDWNLINRTDGSIAKTVKARHLWDLIAQEAWKTGDPGIQYDDIINEWHTTLSDGRNVSSNPCLPRYAKVILKKPDGDYCIEDLGCISVGDEIWSSEGWTKVTALWSTGIKDIYEYRTTAGVFWSTQDHKIVSDYLKVEIKDAENIDTLLGPSILDKYKIEDLNPHDIMSGLLIGDGSIHRASNDLIYLIIGEKDRDYFSSEISHLLLKDRTRGLKGWEVDTILSSNYLKDKTYEREVPVKYESGRVKQKLGFLRGLYSANGSVVDGRITLKAASFDIIRVVQNMLSSLGIQSYYTTNGSHKVKFNNGTYRCKKSYDLNITRDRNIFYNKIGFIQKYKTEKLKLYIDTIQQTFKSRKISFDILSKRYFDTDEVFDLTVDNQSHTFWCNGFNVSNCAEYLGQENTSCNLSGFNLMKFIDISTFDDYVFKHAIRIATVAQNILIDFGEFPIEAIGEGTRKYRNIGLGYSNLGTLLMTKGMPYDSESGRSLAAYIMHNITMTAYMTSTELAEEQGPFERYEANKEYVLDIINKHAMFYGLDDWYKIKERAQEYGVRNASVSLLQPFGTVGLMMDSDTTGIEPELGLVKTKNLIDGGVIKYTNTCVSKALTNLGYSEQEIGNILGYMEQHDTIEGSIVKPEHLAVFDCSFKPVNGTRFIAPEGHIKMLAAVQPHMSHSISKTINMPSAATWQNIRDMYQLAYDLGVKCVAVYRDGSKGAQPLSTSTDEGKRNANTMRKKMPLERQSITHKFEIGNHEGYLTVGLFENGKPGEIFITMGKEGSTLSGIIDAFATLCSIALQYNVPLEVIVNKLKNTNYEPSGWTKHPEIKRARSITDYIGKYLEYKFLTKEEPELDPTQFAGFTTGSVNSGTTCSKCGNMMVLQGRCFFCPNCQVGDGCGG